jgi:hypothetical protein
MLAFSLYLSVQLTVVLECDSRLLCCGHGFSAGEARVQQDCYIAGLLREGWTQVTAHLVEKIFDFAVTETFYGIKL